MKILLLGDFSDKNNEGLKNISKTILKKLSIRNEVKTIDVKKKSIIVVIKLLINYNPDIIHIVSSPSISSLIVGKLLSFRWPRSKIFISALHHGIENVTSILNSKLICRLLKTDVILYQIADNKYENVCKKSYYFPNGIDLEKFSPVSSDVKKTLRLKFGLSPDSFVILHIGHQSDVRNLSLFLTIKNRIPDIDVVIVTSDYVYQDRSLTGKLSDTGCYVINSYVNNIEDVYRLSDLYVFPVVDCKTISMPLTVLEAMACNLRVVTLEQKGLKNILSNQGLYITDNEDALINTIFEIYDTYHNETCDVSTRESVKSLNWDELIMQLECIYEKEMH